MPTLWRQEGGQWRPTSPSGFPLEQTLHDLVEIAPNMLPISGAPRLTVIGKETPLGAGFADLLAVESDGRPVVIEIKLARNPEAKRAVVAQVLSYAASLFEMHPGQLETICASYLRSHDFQSIADAVRAEDQAGAFDEEIFDANLVRYLSEGRVRVVIVLDDAPQDLRVLARYLSVVAERLIVDIVSIQQFDIGVETVMVPELVELERTTAPEPRPSGERTIAASGQLLPGVEPFLAALSQMPVEARSRIESVVAWAQRLEADGLVTLDSYLGTAQTSLLPRLRDEKVGLVTIWALTTSTLSVWRSVFERRAPRALVALESLVERVGQGTSVSPSPAIMEILRGAYEEATGTQADR
jgi:hypothetical protein